MKWCVHIIRCTMFSACKGNNKKPELQLQSSTGFMYRQCRYANYNTACECPAVDVTMAQQVIKSYWVNDRAWANLRPYSTWHRGRSCSVSSSCVLIWGPIYDNVLTSILPWISDYIYHKVWDETTYPFPNFNGGAVEVWERISNFITPCWACDYSSMLGLESMTLTIGPLVKKNSEFLIILKTLLSLNFIW